MTDKRISIRIPTADFKSLLKTAKSEDLTITQVVRRLIREMLEKAK